MSTRKSTFVVLKPQETNQSDATLSQGNVTFRQFLYSIFFHVRSWVILEPFSVWLESPNGEEQFGSYFDWFL